MSALAVRELSDGDFHPTIELTRGVCLVFFSGPHCGACRLLQTLLEAEGYHLGLDTVVKIDAHRNAGLAREFDVFHLPALFLYRDGQYHAAIHAALSVPALRTAINAACQAAAQEAP